jgi:cell wall-associated NlpC family hydrolase
VAKVDGIAVAYGLSGFVLLYSGYANRSLKDTITAFLKGQVPQKESTGPVSLSVSDPDSGSSSGASASGTTPTNNSIANDALQYVGHPYIYGGSPGTNGKSGWDCSSFCNWVLGHDLGMTLPGNSSPGYSGTSHGPTTLSYLTWSGATTIGNTASKAEAGDLCVWQTHMGIATGDSQMVSALDEELGTKVTTISDGAPGGEILFVRRIK